MVYIYILYKYTQSTPQPKVEVEFLVNFASFASRTWGWLKKPPVACMKSWPRPGGQESIGKPWKMVTFPGILSSKFRNFNGTYWDLLGSIWKMVIWWFPLGGTPTAGWFRTIKIDDFGGRPSCGNSLLSIKVVQQSWGVSWDTWGFFGMMVIFSHETGADLTTKHEG